MAKLYFDFQLICSFLQTATDHVLQDLNFVKDPLTLLTFNHGRLQINQAVLLANNEKTEDKTASTNCCGYIQSAVFHGTGNSSAELWALTA